MGGRRVLTTVCVTAAIGLAAGCTPDGGSASAPTPASTSAAGATPATGLPAPRSGHLVRILGNGTWNALSASGYGPERSVNAPGVLAVTPTQSLLGLQGAFPALFEMQADGRVAPVTSPGGVSNAGRPVAAVATPTSLLVAYAPHGLVVADRATGQLRTVSSVPVLPEGSWASAFLTRGGRHLLQYGTDWFEVAGPDTPTPALRQMTAPVPGAIASAQDEDGIVVLTASSLIRVGADGRSGAARAWAMPAAFAGQRVTSATGDGAGGLYATVTTLGNASTSGGVIRVARDGATSIVARGATIDRDSTDCQDADTPVLRSHLGQPMSIVTWQGRLVVADATCHSLLQLPLPVPPA